MNVNFLIIILGGGMFGNIKKDWAGGDISSTALTGHTGRVLSVDSLQKGGFVSGSKDCTIRLWRDDGKCRAIIKAHSAAVNAVLGLEDGNFVSGSSDTTIRIWSHAGALVGTKKADCVTALAALSDEKLASAQLKTILIWNLYNGDAPLQTISLSKVVSSLTSLSTGGFACGTAAKDELFYHSITSSHSIYTYQIEKNGEYKRHRNLTGHNGPVNALLEHSENRIVSGSDDGEVRVWNQEARFNHDLNFNWREEPSSGKIVGKAHALPVIDIAKSKTGMIASASLTGWIRLWNSDGDLVNSLRGHTDEVLAVAWLSDGRLISGSRDSSVRVWDVQPPTQCETPVENGYYTELGDVVEKAEEAVEGVISDSGSFDKLSQKEYFQSDEIPHMSAFDEMSSNTNDSILSGYNASQESN